MWFASFFSVCFFAQAHQQPGAGRAQKCSQLAKTLFCTIVSSSVKTQREERSKGTGDTQKKDNEEKASQLCKHQKHRQNMSPTTPPKTKTAKQRKCDRKNKVAKRARARQERGAWRKRQENMAAMLSTPRGSRSAKQTFHQMR
jgi:hypothetical protein